MTAWPRPWRYRLDARPPAPDGSGDREEATLQAVIRAGRSGDQARAAALYGAPGFRQCGACQVTWHGGPACWCCGRDVTKQDR